MNEANQVFEASLLHPFFGNEAVRGTISVDRFVVRFTAEGISEFIPADKVVIEKEGKRGPISFYDPDRPDLKIFTFDMAIVQAWSHVTANEVRRQMRELAQHAEFSRALRVTLYFLATCVVIALVGSWAMGAIVKSLASRVPPEWEEQFSAEEIKQLHAKYGFIDDSNKVAQLVTLAGPLLRVVGGNTNEFKFHIMEDPVPNAFAMPGGHIVVNTGLLALTDRPEELLGVLAHELAHVKQRHIERKLISAAGPLVICKVLLGSRNGLLNVLSQGSGLLAYESFSQKYEMEADDVGWDYLVEADIDPRGMIDLFKKFEAADPAEGSLVPEAFMSHPSLRRRIARLENRWAKLPKKSGFLELTNPIPKVDLDTNVFKRLWK